MKNAPTVTAYAQRATVLEAVPGKYAPVFASVLALYPELPPAAMVQLTISGGEDASGQYTNVTVRAEGAKT